MWMTNLFTVALAPPRRRTLRQLGVLILTLFSLLSEAPRSVQAQSCVPYPNDRARFGINVARDGNKRIDNYNVAPLNAGWYLDYTMASFPSQPDGMAFAQMIRPALWQSSSFTSTVEQVLNHNLGTLWILGNEPDRDKQDGLTPAAYARFYHTVYHFLKARDTTARIAIAGVVESTPLRRRYLDMVLSAYSTTYGTALPVDVWTVHGFILPENYIWGAAIPPGLEEFAAEGMQYTVSDHDSVTIFQENLIAFRQWMADRGYRDRPLILTEYGILLSPLHGFPYSRVSAFMLDSFDFLRTATSNTTGYPADGNRLVQSWSWFSLNYPPYDETTNEGQNGNLYEPNTAELLPLGADYGNYVNTLPTTNQVQLRLDNLQLTPASVVLTSTLANGTIPQTTPLQNSNAAANRTGSMIIAGSTVTPTLTLTGAVVNAGTADGCRLTLHLWHRTPNGQRTRIESRTIASLGRAAQNEFTMSWPLPQLTPGAHTITIKAQADNAGIGLPIDSVERQLNFNIYIAPLTTSVYLPLINR